MAKPNSVKAKKQAKDQVPKESNSEEQLEIPPSSEEESDQSFEELSDESSEEDEEEKENSTDSDSSLDVEEDDFKLDGLEDESSKTKAHKVQTKHKISTAKNTSKKEKKGVLYIGRIPHGFYEEEMRKYFTQFGEITRLRISRNKKTGKSKHYGFIEFKDYDVARIAAEAMNNYLLFGHLLQVHIIADEGIHNELFAGSSKKFKVLPRKNIALRANDTKRSAEDWDRLSEKFKSKKQKKADFLKKKGIDFDPTVL